jgi:putative membrane protein
MTLLSQNQLHKLLLFCCVVYFFGVLGMLSPAAAWFVSMTPLSLLLSFLTLWLHQEKHTSKTRMFWIVAFLVGFGIEVIGVNTGWPFGHYVYGNVLGPKLMNTPLMLGVNWTLITYTSFYVFDKVAPKLSTYLFLPLAALIPTAIDYLIEPVAIALGMWTWPSTTTPPLQNYVGWYVTSLVLAIVWRWTMPRSLKNGAAVVLLILQVAFFAVLGLLLG